MARPVESDAGTHRAAARDALLRRLRSATRWIGVGTVVAIGAFTVYVGRAFPGHTTATTAGAGAGGTSGTGSSQGTSGAAGTSRTRETASTSTTATSSTTLRPSAQAPSSSSTSPGVVSGAS